MTEQGLTSKVSKYLTQLHIKKSNNLIKNEQKTRNDLSFSKDYIQKANKFIKGHSTSLTIREMQIHTEMSPHTCYNTCDYKHTHTHINKCWQGCEETETLVHCWQECKMLHLVWKTVQRFLKILKIELPYDPATIHLDIYPKQLTLGCQRDICTPNTLIL